MSFATKGICACIFCLFCIALVLATESSSYDYDHVLGPSMPALSPELLSVLAERRSQLLPHAIRSPNRRTLGGQSPSCFVNSACRTDAGFAASVSQFLSHVEATSPDLAKWGSNRFQKYLCNLLSDPGFGARNRDDDDDNDLNMHMKLKDFFVKWLVTTYWLTEPGLFPYPTPTFWWCFLDSDSVYQVAPQTTPGPAGYLVTTGMPAITARFAGLGINATGGGGAGFYVSILQMNGSYATVRQNEGVLVGHSRAFKQLVSTDITNPGTTKLLDLYQVDIELVQHDGYPKFTIKTILEMINLFQTFQWLRVLHFFCTSECSPGGSC